MATTVADLEVRATGNTKDAEKDVKRLSKRINSTEADTRAASTAFLGVGVAVAAGFGIAINTAANFEAAISGIGAVAGLSGDQLEQVRQKALQLGSDTVFSATESAAAMETLLKAGMPIETVLKDGAQAALDLAAATGTDVVTSAELLTNAINVFGDAAGSATDVANLFTAAANASATSVDKLALGFSQSAAVAKLMGLGVDDLTVALALFSQNGLQGSDAGTSFKTMLMSMANPTKEQKALMDQLGISFFDAQGNFIGLDAAAAVLQTGLAGMTQEQRNATLATLFGSDAVRAASILYDEGADGVKQMRTEMAGQATAAEQAAARMDNLKGAIEQLKGTVETALIMVGDRFTPALQSLAEKAQSLMAAFNNLSPAMQDQIIMGVALFGGLMALAGALGIASVALGPVIAGFGLLLSPIGLVVAAIAGLFIAYQTNFLGFRDGVHAALDALGNYFAGFEENVNAAKSAFMFAWPAMSAVLDVAWGIIKGIIDGMVQSITGMAQIIGGIIKVLVSAITLDFDGMKEGVSMIVDGLVNIVGGYFTALSAVVGGIVGGIKKLVVAIWNALKDDVVSTATGLKDDVIKKFGDLLSTGSVIITGLKTAVVNIINTMKDDALGHIDTFVTDSVSKVTGLATDLYNAAWSAGKQLGEGLKAGIAAMKDAALGAAQDIVDAVIDKLKNIPGFSPIAHVGQFYGEKLGMGFAEGIASAIPSTINATSDLTGASIDRMATTARPAAPVVMAPPSGPRSIIYQTNHYTVSIDQLEDVARAAEFVRDLPGERELVLGGAFAM